MPFTEIKSQTSLTKIETSDTEKCHISVTKKQQLVPSQTSFLVRWSPVLKDYFNQCRTSAHRILVTQSEPKRCRRAKLSVAERSPLAQNDFTSLHIKIVLFTGAKNFSAIWRTIAKFH